MKLNDKSIELNSDEFEETVRNLVSKYSIEEVVETGTYLGTGSTLIFAKTGLPVVSLECVRGNVEVARENLKDYPNVRILHAHSLPLPDMLDAIVEMSQREFPDHIRCDHRDPVTFYMNEISNQADVEHEDALWRLLVPKDKRQIVFLDSSGGVGYAEAQLVLKKCAGSPKLLMFDDIDHVKHYYTGFMLGKEGILVNKSSDGRFAWAWLGDTDV